MARARVHVSAEAAEAMADDGIGLGDLVAALTKRLGIRECDGCRRRKAALNRVKLGRRKRRHG